MGHPTKPTIGEMVRSLRIARDITGAELARRAGTSKETISKIETGRTVQSKVLSEIARVLNVPLDDILSAESAPHRPPPSARGAGAKGGAHDQGNGKLRPMRRANALRASEGIPLYSSGESTDGTIFIVFEPVDVLRRPDPLLHVQGAYALLVDGNSMVPALEPGDLALVNPHLFPRKGMNALFLQARGDGDERVRASLKRFEGQTDRIWRAFQWQPSRSVSYDKAEWPRIHSVVGKYAWR